MYFPFPPPHLWELNFFPVETDAVNSLVLREQKYALKRRLTLILIIFFQSPFTIFPPTPKFVLPQQPLIFIQIYLLQVN